MKLMLKSIIFGVTLTAVLSALTYGLATLTKFLQTLGDAYPFIFLLVLFCAGCSAAYYFGNK